MLIKEGIIASPGIVIAKALVYEKIIADVNKNKAENAEAEILKFQAAVQKSHEQLEAIRVKAVSELGEEEAAIFPSKIHEIIKIAENDRLTDLKAQIDGVLLFLLVVLAVTF